jgi:hypothetical protein
MNLRTPAIVTALLVGSWLPKHTTARGVELKLEGRTYLFSASGPYVVSRRQ